MALLFFIAENGVRQKTRLDLVLPEGISMSSLSNMTIFSASDLIRSIFDP